MKKAFAIVGLAVGIVLLVWMMLTKAGFPGSDAREPEAVAANPIPEASSREKSSRSPVSATAKAGPEGEGREDQERTETTADAESDEAEAQEEAKVEAFDALTDKWMEPSGKGVAMSDVEDFLARFSNVPSDRKQECLQRALNLIPDENTLLLMGVLLDKSQPRELAELVFNDMLNRDESVKDPMLRQILKDKTHPCWADAAWILDVTGGEHR